MVRATICKIWSLGNDAWCGLGLHPALRLSGGRKGHSHGLPRRVINSVTVVMALKKLLGKQGEQVNESTFASGVWRSSGNSGAIGLQRCSTCYVLQRTV